MNATQNTLPNDVETLKTMVFERDALLCERDALLCERDAMLCERDAKLQSHESSLALRDAQLAEQQATISQLQRLNEGLSHRLDLALRRIYGRSSERLDPKQLLLFGQQMQQAAEAVEKLAELQEKSSVKRKGHGRRRLPENLPRHRIEHAIDPAELICPCCQQPRVRIGEDENEQLDYIPASLFVVHHIRPKYACPNCEDGGVVTAEQPEIGQVIAKGLPGPGLVAHVITSKYADHQPLYRQEGMLRRHGVPVSRSTMCGWTQGAADLLWPLVKRMGNLVVASKVIHTDDTPVPVQDKGRGKTRTGRLWVYVGDASHPYTVYDYTPDRSRDGPVSWLKDFKGYLQADAYGGYDEIYAGGNVFEVACWAHSRRKFYEARHSDATRSHHVLAMIRLLYDVERKAKELDAAERASMRQEQSVPLLGQLYGWLMEAKEQVLPKSPMGTAIHYALNQWEALVRYTTDGDLSIDNNPAEQAIRPLTVGRKNYLFVGSDRGGRTAAILYSVTASARRHGIDPFIYLRDVLANIGSTPLSQLDQFLPDRWRDERLKELAAG